jgi:hypothetical protein
MLNTWSLTLPPWHRWWQTWIPTQRRQETQQMNVKGYPQQGKYSNWLLLNCSPNDGKYPTNHLLWWQAMWQNPEHIPTKFLSKMGINPKTTRAVQSAQPDIVERKSPTCTTPKVQEQTKWW